MSREASGKLWKRGDIKIDKISPTNNFLKRSDIGSNAAMCYLIQLKVVEPTIIVKVFCS